MAVRRYFLGANTGKGFVSLYEEFCKPESGNFLYVIKGGPGCGKSTAMKQAAREGLRRQQPMEIIHCSSDPSSLDGVLFPEQGKALYDGTAPHTIDLPFPGAQGGYILPPPFLSEEELVQKADALQQVQQKLSACYRQVFTLTAAAQTDRRIEEQKRVIAALEKRIATEEQEISKIQKGRTATEERVRRLACQIDSRNQLLDETEKQARLLRGEIARTDSVAGNLSAKLERDRAQYGEMVREAYRNYKHNNYLTYIFSSRDFTDVARKITALREVASLRERKLRDIEALTAEVRTEKETLDRRKRSLDSVTRSLSAQREKLQRDARNAKASIRSMSQKEKTALQRKIAQEQQLDVAIGELRKLTKGNTEGASFSAKTSGLRLPVTAGRVKRYKENMAEITGPKGAHVISIYDGKVVDVKRNRITNKYDVYVAHGEYITSYANMGTICVEKGQKVARNAQIGTIGSAVNVMTMETEYKLVFGIYPPNPGQKMRAEECFRK